MCSPLRRLHVVPVALAAALVGAPAAAATVGVFPFRVAAPNATELQALGLGDGLPVLLAHSLGESETG